MEIHLNTLKICTFDKNKLDDLNFLKKLCKDNSIKKRFQGITIGLLNNPNNEFFEHGFFVKENEEYIGYIGIGKYNTYDKSIYLRAAIDSNKRCLSYGTKLLSEITEYIFKNYSEVESIRLKISKDNTSSIKVALSNEYKYTYNDFYIKYNHYNKLLKKKYI